MVAHAFIDVSNLFYGGEVHGYIYDYLGISNTLSIY